MNPSFPRHISAPIDSPRARFATDCQGNANLSTIDTSRYATMAVTAPIRMAAHARSNDPLLMLVSTMRPRTSDDPPKYSPTTAPMKASVVPTFSAVKKNGSAFGMRTLRSTAPGPAAYERISSSEDGCTSTRPRVTLTTIGKNTSSDAIAIFESGLSTPNQLFRMGAMAMIGMALDATAKGSMMSRAMTKRAAAKATANPATVPMTSPPIASVERRHEST